MSRTIKKILLVDDEVAVRNLYQIFLEKNGFVVFTAGGVREALQALHDLEFDVAIIDLQLTDGTGMDIIRRAKLDGEPKLLAMTGYAQTPESSAELDRSNIAVYNKLEPISELVRLISVV